MYCAMSDASVVAEELYELCEKNGFIDARLVVTGMPRRNSEPALLLSTFAFDEWSSEDDVEQADSIENCVPSIAPGAWGSEDDVKQADSIDKDVTSTRIPDVDSQGREGDAERPRRVTTLMLRNVPCKVNFTLMDLTLRQLGFQGTYNYIHFPTKKSTSNLGFGFVNFIKEQDALRFQAVFTGYRFPGINSRKQCYASPADTQGPEANLELHPKSSPILL